MRSVIQRGFSRIQPSLDLSPLHRSRRTYFHYMSWPRAGGAISEPVQYSESANEYVGQITHSIGVFSDRARHEDTLL